MQNQNNTETGAAHASLDQAFALAFQAHQSGDFETAKSIYQNILSVIPNEVNALHFLGIALHQSGDSNGAIDIMERSISLDPNPQLDRYSNLSRVLLEAGHYEKASEVYIRVLQLSPTNADVHNNFAVLLLAQKRFEEASDILKKALSINPLHAEAHYNIGESLAMQGNKNDCVPFYEKALTLKPSHIGAKKKLSFAYYTLGELDKAANIYRQWLEQEPDNPIARHHLAACTQEAVPARADDAYIESTFDDFAASFDSQLSLINYQAPQLLAEEVRRTYGAATKQFSILDAGCGTGLCGALINEYAAKLIGVDLSNRMLEKANAQNVYDSLVKAELTTYLHSQPHIFDTIISADTLIYFGALEELFTAARAALRDHGYLFFTVESHEAADNLENGYRINPHGRYSHSEPYLRAALNKTGFSINAIKTAIMRYEGGNPAYGFVVSCRAA